MAISDFYLRSVIGGTMSNRSIETLGKRIQKILREYGFGDVRVEHLSTSLIYADTKEEVSL